VSDVFERLKRVFVSKAFGDASWLISGGTFRAATAFFANLALVRLLSPEDFGQFAIIQADVSLVGALLNFQTGPLLLRASDEELEEENLSRYTGALIAETLLVGSGAVITLWVLNLLTVGAVILLITSLATTWVQTELRLYERTFEYKRITYTESVAHFLSRLFAVAGAYLGMGPIVLYLRNTIRQTVIFEGLRRLGGLTAFPLRWLTLRDWQAYLKKLKGFWADGLLERMFDRAVVMTIGGLTGEETTGYFYQARRLAITPNQVLRPFSYRMAFNHFSNRISEGNRYSTLWKGLLVEIGVLGLAVLTAWFFANPVVPWLFGEEWRPVVPMLLALSGVIIGMPMFGTLQVYFKAQNRMRPFIIWARGFQYVMIAVAAIMAFRTPLNAGVLLSIGLSASFTCGSFAAWGIAYYQR
jgi:PST family polysaccharide transporter